MPLLTRDEIKKIVEGCLRKIGDFQGDVESFKLSGSHKLSLDKFADCIAEKLEEANIIFDISVNVLTEMKAKDETIGDLIERIDSDQEAD